MRRALLLSLTLLLPPAARADAPVFSNFSIEVCRSSDSATISCIGHPRCTGAGGTIHTTKPRFDVQATAAGVGFQGSCTQFAQPSPSLSGQQALWRLDGDGADASGNSNDLSFTTDAGGGSAFTSAQSGLGSAWRPAQDTGGIPDAGHATAAIPYAFAGTDFTIEAWVYVTGDACDSTGCADAEWPILTTCGSVNVSDACLAVGLANRKPTMRFSASAPVGGVWDNLSGNATASSALSLNTWHHLAFVADGTTKRIYVDGSEVRTEASQPTYIGVVNTMYVGGLPPGTYPLNWADRYANGRIDSLRVYNRKLSNEEIRAHRYVQFFSVNSNQSFNGDLSGQFCTGASPGINNWTWYFGARPSALGAGANTFRFGALDASENTGSDGFSATVTQTPAAMSAPPAPAVVDVGVTSATWNVASWRCDSSYTYYSFSPSWSAGASTQSAKAYTPTYLSPNRPYGLAARATYVDVGGSFTTIGPSAASAFAYTTTYANVPGTPGDPIPAGPTSAIFLAGLGSGNPTYTEQNLEGSTDGGSTFSQVADYAPYSGFPFGYRGATDLEKSKRYTFRARNRNLAGVVTPPSAATSGSMVTQPATPTGMRGQPAVGTGLCPKTDIRWSWSSVAMGSGAAERYELWREDGTTSIPGATLSSNTYVEQGLSPNTPRQAVAQAFDMNGTSSPDIRYSDYSSTATAATAGPEIAAPAGLAGTPASLPFLFTTLPGVSWTWSVPDYLCPGWTYQILNAQTGALIATTAADAAPAYDQYVFVPNTLASIRVRGVDSFATGTLSESATAYSPAATPASLSAAGVSTGSLTLAWSASGNPSYTRYEVSVSTDNFATVNSSPVVLGQDLTATSAGVSGLQPATTYYLRVRAYNGRSSDPYGGIPGGLSATLALMTLTQPPALSAAVLGPTALQWSWTAVSGASGYRLRDERGNVLLDTPSGLSYSSTSLSANGSYGAFVEAYNGQGLGNPSATFYAFTGADAPTSPSVVSVGSNTVSYSWSGGSNPSYTFYELNVATDSLFGAVVSTRNTTATSLRVDSLFPGTTYHARVRAFSGSQTPTAYASFAAAVTAADPQVSLSSAPASPYSSYSGAVGVWHLDEGSGLSAADATANANAGALTCLTGGCASTPTFTGGPPDLGGAVAFPGVSGSLIAAPHVAAYAFTGSMTISAWVKAATAAMPDGAGIAAKGDGGAESFALDVVTTGGQKRCRFIARPGFVAVATSTLRVGEWDHVVGVFDDAADEARIYVNGALSATTAIALARISNTHALSIGARQSGGGAYDLPFAGAIDEVRFLNVALSAAQVAADYRASYPATFALPPPNDDVTLTLPPNAFGGGVVFYASRDPLAHPLRIGPAALLGGLLDAPTGQALAPGSLIEIVPVAGGVPFTANLGSPATVSLPYPDTNGDGLVDGLSPQVPVGRLQVYTLNTTIGRWEALPTTVDRAARRASAPTPHFSVFALFGPSTVGATLSQVRVYPVPWKPGRGGRFDAPALTFDLLPAAGSVRIFTLSGEQVVELPFSGADAGRVTWNGRNAAGRSAASGVYFAYVRSERDGATTVLKFALER